MVKKRSGNQTKIEFFIYLTRAQTSSVIWVDFVSICKRVHTNAGKQKTAISENKMEFSENLFATKYLYITTKYFSKIYLNVKHWKKASKFFFGKCVRSWHVWTVQRCILKLILVILWRFQDLQNLQIKFFLSASQQNLVYYPGMIGYTSSMQTFCQKCKYKYNL